jgi:pyridinium-3,5-biscarboxylic acid mononucleotide sulfurtransferase
MTKNLTFKDSLPSKSGTPGNFTIEQKYKKLKEIIKSLQRVVVAFSGGVDSTLLLKVCLDVLGKENVLAFIGLSPTCPQREIDEAKRTAEFIGSEYLIAETDEMRDPNFIQNSKARCYFCKTHLFDKAWAIAKERGFLQIVEGSNLDDLDDIRPGQKACNEQKIISPLLMAELSKMEIRQLSKTLSLPTHDKPSFACLSSRIPYGTPIDRESLKRIELSEDFIRSLGIKQIRVRSHGNVARIETLEGDLDKIMLYKGKIVEALKKYGFTFISLDLQGYRTGSMNISPISENS